MIDARHGPAALLVTFLATVVAEYDGAAVMAVPHPAIRSVFFRDIECGILNIADNDSSQLATVLRCDSPISSFLTERSE